MLRLLCLFPLLSPDPAGGGAGGAGGAGGVATPPVVLPADGGQSAPWFSTFKNDETRGYVESKGFKDSESLADAYRNLEKLRGVPAEKLLTLPGDDKPESWAPIYNRLGRPEKVDGYELTIPEGAPETFGPEMSGKFHELGLSKKQGQALADWWNELVVKSNGADKEAAGASFDTQVAALKSEWGAAFDQNLDRVSEFAEKAGIDENTAAKLRGALGVDGFAKMLDGMMGKFGIKLGESQFHTGGENTGFGRLSPSASRAKRQELQSDPDFMAKWVAGSKKEVDQVNKLYEMEFVNQT